MPATDTTATRARAQLAAETLSARWAPRILRTLPHAGPVAPAAILAGAPMIPKGSLYYASAQLTDAGLLTKVPLAGIKSRRYGLALTDAGRAVAPVHQTALHWAQRHRTSGTARAVPEAIEDVLSLLANPLTAPLLTELAVHHRPASYLNLTDSLPPETHTLLHQRLSVLTDRGLVARAGTPRTYRWAITPAGVQIGAVFAELAHWAADHQPAPQQPAHPGTAVAAAGRNPVVLAAPPAPGRATDPRAQAAHLRSLTLHLTFSHAPSPQPARLLQTVGHHR